MRWLYHLQQHLALTTAEAKALTVVTCFLLTGLGVRYAQAYWPTSLPEPVLLTETIPISVAPPDTSTTEKKATEEEPAPDPTQTGTRLNLNTASARLLQTLPGIGPKLAERIIKYRTAHGPFARVAHLTRVKGIGAKKLEKLTPLLTVE